MELYTLSCDIMYNAFLCVSYDIFIEFYASSIQLSSVALDGLARLCTVIMTFFIYLKKNLFKAGSSCHTEEEQRSSLLML